MKLYLGGNSQNTGHEKELKWLKHISYRIGRFHYFNQLSVILLAIKEHKIMKAKKVELFLDSGAFSAWNQGVEINVKDYIKFIKEHKEMLSVYAVLDVIGDAEGTWKNQKIMEKAGLNPLPCFHFGEPWKYLERYINEYDYLAIGGLARRGNKPETTAFLDRAFDMICDEEGLPKIKIHGFAVTGMKLMKRYPWFSVDSTTWLLTSRMGNILVPHKLPNGEWDYLETLPQKITRKICVSTISPSAGTPDDHYSTFSKQWQREVDEWIEQHGFVMGKSSFRKVKPGYVLKEGERWAKMIGVGDSEYEEEFGISKEAPTKKDFVETVEEPGLSNDYVARDILNASYFRELQERFPKYPWRWPRPKLQGFGF